MNIAILKEPIVTEKATRLQAFRQYVFRVSPGAAASEIRRALKARYGVDAMRVNLITVKPKPRRWGRRTGVKPGYKKAIVTLKPGQKLDILPHAAT